uniref:Uncharacterized protein n=1 Tax=Rhipicephalus zambeziensis TaxID=60191 RepID=A0A224Y7H5_9ACAR
MKIRQICVLPIILIVAERSQRQISFYVIVGNSMLHCNEVLPTANSARSRAPGLAFETSALCKANIDSHVLPPLATPASTLSNRQLCNLQIVVPQPHNLIMMVTNC